MRDLGHVTKTVGENRPLTEAELTGDRWLLDQFLAGWTQVWLLAAALASASVTAMWVQPHPATGHRACQTPLISTTLRRLVLEAA